MGALSTRVKLRLHRRYHTHPGQTRTSPYTQWKRSVCPLRDYNVPITPQHITSVKFPIHGIRAGTIAAAEDLFHGHVALVFIEAVGS
jgi:hypothetical protein